MGLFNKKNKKEELEKQRKDLEDMKDYLNMPLSKSVESLEEEFYSILEIYGKVEVSTQQNAQSPIIGPEKPLFDKLENIAVKTVKLIQNSGEILRKNNENPEDYDLRPEDKEKETKFVEDMQSFKEKVDKTIKVLESNYEKLPKDESPKL